MHRRLGLILLYGGAAVCVLGALGFAFGMTLTISEALAWRIVRAAAYVAPLLVGGALMGGGAWLLRATRPARTEAPPPAAAPAALPEPRVGGVPSGRGEMPKPDVAGREPEQRT